MRPITLLFVLVCAGCIKEQEIPDLPLPEAARIISAAPEFSQYARLVSVDKLSHPTDSLNSVTFGEFTFRYLDSPADSEPVKGDLEFRYLEGAWYLNGFTYNCPGPHCQRVKVFDGPDRRRSLPQAP